MHKLYISIEHTLIRKSMSTNDEDIVVTIDAKRLIAIGLLAILTIATLSSYIIAILAWVAPDASYLTKVTELDTYDGAVPDSTFDPGDTVTVKATIEKATAYDNPSYTVVSDTSAARIYIVVYYDSGTKLQLLHIYTTATTLTPGDPFPVQTQFKLSSSAVTSSNYYVHCLVWDTTLPDGDTLTDWSNFNTEQQVTFSVGGPT
jgi:hypothetical protein